MSSYPGPVILGLALPLVVGPPNLQNQLTLTSEGALNYCGFDRSSQTASFGGEGLEKYNPGKSVYNRDKTTGRCKHIRKRSTVHRFIRNSLELNYRCAAESTRPLFVPPRTFSLVRH